MCFQRSQEYLDLFCWLLSALFPHLISGMFAVKGQIARSKYNTLCYRRKFEYCLGTIKLMILSLNLWKGLSRHFQGPALNKTELQTAHTKISILFSARQQTSRYVAQFALSLWPRSSEGGRHVLKVNRMYVRLARQRVTQHHLWKSLLMLKIEHWTLT